MTFNDMKAKRQLTERKHERKTITKLPLMNCDRIKSRLVPFSHHFVVRGQDRKTPPSPPHKEGKETHFVHLHLLYHLQIYYIFCYLQKLISTRTNTFVCDSELFILWLTDYCCLRTTSQKVNKIHSIDAKRNVCQKYSY